jgi:hypothetical protein
MRACSDLLKKNRIIGRRAKLSRAVMRMLRGV